MTARKRTKAEPGSTITFRLTRAERQQIEQACEQAISQSDNRPALDRPRRLTVSEFIKRAVAARLAGDLLLAPQHCREDLRREAIVLSKTLSGWMRAEPDNWHQQTVRRQFEQLIIAIDAMLERT